MNRLKLSIWTIALFVTSFAGAQITVTNTLTPEELVNDILVGSGVTVSNIEFNHSIPFAGLVQAQAGYFDASGTTFPISEGILLTTGNVRLAVGPNDSGSATDNEGVATDPDDIDLDAIGTTIINDEAIIEFDFVPSGDSVVFKYIFASEEYHEYSTSTFNDVFGFFISGPGFAGPYEFGGENLAIIPGTSLPVTMNNLNNGTSNTGPCINCEFLIDNAGGVDIQYDAHTVIMYARAEVVCGETYHIKMAIGDAGDNALDSGVFLEASSFSSNGITVEIASVLGEDAIIEGCDSAMVCFIRPEDSDTIDLSVDFDISGTATNGVDYDFIDETVFFPEGEDTVKFWIVPSDEGVIEGAESVIITVEIINECGDTITTEATIEIIDPQDYDLITTDITLICPEDSVLLTFDTDGGIPEFDITWSSGGSGMEEWVPGDIEGTTTYTITTVDHCGVESTGTIDVIFDPATLSTITFNEDLFIICPDQEADIDATVHDAYDEDAITYSWSPSGETVEDITVSPDVLTWYYLTVFDGCNTITDSVKIEMGTVDLTDIIVTDATDCPGQPDAVPGEIIVEPNMEAGWEYELIGYGGPQDNGTFGDLSGGIDYILRVTDEDGCTLDTIVPVGLGEHEVVATWVIDSLRDVSCFGADDGGAYVFEIGGGITAPYDVIWTNVDGVFDSETVAVDGSSDHDDLPGGIWVVTVVDQEGCAWSQSFEINEPDELTMDVIFNVPTCYGYRDASVTVNTTGGNDGKVYEIRDEDGTLLNEDNSNTANLLPTGTYTISVVDENGCSVSGSVFIDQPGQIDVTLDIQQPLCYGIETGYVEVTDVINYQGEYDSLGYYWAPNPSGNDGIGAYFSNHMGAGDYTVRINDKNGCSRIFDFTIIYPEELIFAELGFDSAYCRLYGYQNGGGVVYAAGGGGTPDYDYLWTEISTGNTTVNTTWGGRNPGEYIILIRDNVGCTLTDTITVDSLNPIAYFSVDSDQLNADCKGTADVEVEFTNESRNYANPNNPNPQPRFFWNLDSPEGDLQITDDFEQKFDTIYKARGESYIVNVCLLIQNSNGCQDEYCKEIEIFEPIRLDEVNIFSPNGDGINDEFTFKFKSASISEFDCVIMNRWGIVVGTINTPTGGWDGTDQNGDPCTNGVYFYKFVAKADNATVIERQGTITIVSAKQ